MTLARQEKMAEAIRKVSAKFFLDIAPLNSLVTVTAVNVESNLKKASIFFTVYPESKENETLENAKRSENGLRAYLAENIKFRAVPEIECTIDLGEKNRQKIDKISNKL